MRLFLPHLPATYLPPLKDNHVQSLSIPFIKFSGGAGHAVFQVFVPLCSVSFLSRFLELGLRRQSHGNAETGSEPNAGCTRAGSHTQPHAFANACSHEPAMERDCFFFNQSESRQRFRLDRR